MSLKAFKLTIDLGDDVVWVCKARRQSREEYTPAQKRDTEDVITNKQQMQQKPQDQSLPLSQGQWKHFKVPRDKPQGEHQQLHTPKLSQKVWTEQWQREIQHEKFQKQYQHSQQQVQFEPFHQQFTDEMQKLQDKAKQEKLPQEWSRQFENQVQEQPRTEQSHNKDECPIPHEYKKAQNSSTKQPLSGQYQPHPQAPNQYRQEHTHYRQQFPYVRHYPHVRHYPQPPHVNSHLPQCQVWCHPYYKPWNHPFQPWQPQPQGILWTLQAQYQHLGQQIQHLSWQQWVQSQSEKQQWEMQDQKRFQTWQKPTSRRPTECQEAQYDACRERHQLQPRKEKQQSRAHEKSNIPNFSQSPFVMDEDSDDIKEEKCSEGDKDEYEFPDETDESDSDLESQRQSGLESEDESENDSEECNECENESEFVII